jgi:hypothetical protein
MSVTEAVVLNVLLDLTLFTLVAAVCRAAYQSAAPR